MKISTACINVSLILLALISLAAPVTSRALVPESVQAAIDSAASDSYIDILLSFNNDLDQIALKMSNLKDHRTRLQNYREVMNRLDVNHRQLENDISPILENMIHENRIDSYKIFTVSKTILVKTHSDNVENLLAIPGVYLININSPISLVAPVEEKLASDVADGELANDALNAINIRSLWSRGLTGNGVLICSFDTGIDGTHEALGPKWRGNNGATAGESWFAPHGGTFPADGVGHGSHVMGIMLGSTATDTIGVAPGAQWISAAVIDQGANFTTTIADILSAFEWALNPDGNINTTDDIPDVICNSWGVPKGIYADCDNTFWTAIDNVEAAGIITIFAAGNEGPNPQSIRNPADRASSPLNAFSVGAVNSLTNEVAPFSSRGPANCNNSIIKPEVVAPGVSIYSSYKDGQYKYMSGTSMATPFVAGLAALLRQYNPEASVTEIKTAILSAAHDLNPVGEDNDYGFGLIDASNILNYIPEPTEPGRILVYNHNLTAGGDSFADPGENADLYLTINDPTANIGNIDVWVTSTDPAVSFASDTIRYTFAPGSVYAVSTEAFAMGISADAISGSNATISVHSRIPGYLTVNTIDYTITLGHKIPGAISDASTGEIHFTTSEFGQFGFGNGSIYQAGGNGFIYAAGDNLLFEAGFIVGRNGQMIADAIRNENGEFKVSDFVPAVPTATAAAIDDRLVAGYSDGNSAVPIPIKVTQTTYRTGEDFIILEFDITNPTAERIDQLSYGLFLDFDINRFNDDMRVDSMIEIMYQYDDLTGMYVGVLGLSPVEYSQKAFMTTDAAKPGFTKQQKFDMVNGSGIQINGSGAGDWYMTISSTNLLVNAFATHTMAVAIVAGRSVEDLQSNALLALSEYDAFLDAEDELAALPEIMTLSQNYPNPFNPTTTISYLLGSSSHVTLDVYNVIGQKVRTLVDSYEPAGENNVIWDSRDDNGSTVASGIYLYRLTVDNESETRKMVLLK